MFGPAYYYNKIAHEIFLRYLNEGIQEIKVVRKALYFIPDKTFAYILKISSERNLISINILNGTIFMSKKTHDVIKFIEEYNIIEELEKKGKDNSFQFSKELNLILRKINFNQNNFDLNKTISNAMRVTLGKNVNNDEDYATEILNFRFYIHNAKSTNVEAPAVEEREDNNSNE